MKSVVIGVLFAAAVGAGFYWKISQAFPPSANRQLRLAPRPPVETWTLRGVIEEKVSGRRVGAGVIRIRLDKDPRYQHERDGMFTAPIKPDGSFEMEVAEGATPSTFRISAEWEDAKGKGLIFGSRWDGWRGKEYRNEPVTIQVDAFPSISGRIVDEDSGQPVPGVSLTRRYSDVGFELTSDAEGWFCGFGIQSIHSTVTNWSFDLSLRRNGYQPRFLQLPMSRDKSRHRDLLIRMKKGHPLRGLVMFEDGTPVEKAVVVFHTGDSAPKKDSITLLRSAAVTATDREGRFAFESLPLVEDGRLFVDGWGSVPLQKSGIKTGVSARTVAVVLPRTKRIRVVASTPREGPGVIKKWSLLARNSATGARRRVFEAPEGGRWVYAIEGEELELMAEAIPRETAPVILKSRDHVIVDPWPQRVEVTLKPGTPPWPLPIDGWHASAGWSRVKIWSLRYELSFVDERGNPVKGRRFHLDQHNGSGTSIVSGDQGDLSFGFLPGWQMLRVTVPGFRECWLALDGRPGRTMRYTVVLQPERLR